MKNINLLILFALLCFSKVYAQQIDYIGGGASTSNSNFPVNNSSTQSYSEAIYKKTEITSLTTIYGIEYSVKSGSFSGGNNWDIYLKEKDKSNYTWGISSFEQDGLTQVYSGNVSISNNKIRIYFDTPFTYTGAEGLVVIVHKKNAGTGNVVYNQTSASTVRCASYSNTTITPENLPSNQVIGKNENPVNQYPRKYYRPQMGFISTPKCEAPTGFVITNTTASGTRIDFDGQNGATWGLTLEGTTTVLTDTFDIITGLSNNTAYSMTVKSDCGTGGTSPNGTVSFRTNICDEGPVANFSEDFSTPDFFSNSCWSQIGRPASGSTIFSATQVNNKIQYHPNSAGILVLPEVKDIASGTLTFSYSGYYNLLQIGTVNIPYESSSAVYSNIETIVALPGNFIESSTTPIVHTIDLSDYVGTDKYLVIRGRGAPSINGNLFVDDVSFSSPDTAVTKQICKRDSYAFGALSLMDEGTYYDTITTNIGDSIIRLKLDVLEPYTNTIQVVSCDTYTSPTGNVYSVSGTYSDTLANQMGCDSIIVTELTVLQTPNVSNISEDNIDKCQSEIITITPPDAKIGENYTVKNYTTGSIFADPVEITETTTGISLQNLASATIEIIATTSVNNVVCTAPSKLIIVNSIAVDATITTAANTIQVADDQNATYKWSDCNTNTTIDNEADNNYTPTTSGDYKVEITNGACVKTSQCINLLINGLHKVTEGSVTIAPNPISSHMKINSIHEIEKVEIYSIDGVLVQSDNKSVAIDTSSLETGIYQVIVFTEAGVSVQKLVKE